MNINKTVIKNIFKEQGLRVSNSAVDYMIGQLLDLTRLVAEDGSKLVFEDKKKTIDDSYVEIALRRILDGY